MSSYRSIPDGAFKQMASTSISDTPDSPPVYRSLGLGSNFSNNSSVGGFGIDTPFEQPVYRGLALPQPAMTRDFGGRNAFGFGGVGSEDPFADNVATKPKQVHRSSPSSITEPPLLAPLPFQLGRTSFSVPKQDSPRLAKSLREAVEAAGATNCNFNAKKWSLKGNVQRNGEVSGFKMKVFSKQDSSYCVDCIHRRGSRVAWSAFYKSFLEECEKRQLLAKYGKSLFSSSDVEEPSPLGIPLGWSLRPRGDVKATTATSIDSSCFTSTQCYSTAELMKLMKPLLDMALSSSVDVQKQACLEISRASTRCSTSIASALANFPGLVNRLVELAVEYSPHGTNQQFAMKAVADIFASLERDETNMFSSGFDKEMLENIGLTRTNVRKLMEGYEEIMKNSGSTKRCVLDNTSLHECQRIFRLLNTM
eukprot:g2104.t1